MVKEILIIMFPIILQTNIQNLSPENVSEKSEIERDVRSIYKEESRVYGYH